MGKLNKKQQFEKAMQELYDLNAPISMILSINEPSTYAHAEGIFQKLRSQGINPTEEDIYEKAIEHGWDRKEALKLSSEFGR